MENFKKGAKRKCTKCSTLFFDFGKFPIVCPSCGEDVNSLLTNVSKRGRPPKNPKPQISVKSKDENIENVDTEKHVEGVEIAEGVEGVEGVENDEAPVEEIVEIEREQES
jgi:uncharacterized protein (TIGR02300 family)